MSDPELTQRELDQNDCTRIARALLMNRCRHLPGPEFAAVVAQLADALQTAAEVWIAEHLPPGEQQKADLCECTDRTPEGARCRACGGTITS